MQLSSAGNWVWELQLHPSDTKDKALKLHECLETHACARGMATNWQLASVIEFPHTETIVVQY